MFLVCDGKREGPVDSRLSLVTVSILLESTKPNDTDREVDLYTPA